jgi:hypothetical protein
MKVGKNYRKEEEIFLIRFAQLGDCFVPVPGPRNDRVQFRNFGLQVAINLQFHCKRSRHVPTRYKYQ